MTRKITAILAMDENRLIGKDNKLPWHIHRDFIYFKNKTMGNIMVMGRKTFESFGRPLPGRDHWVLTRDPKTITPHPRVSVFTSVEDILNKTNTDLFIIGGLEIYKAFLPHTDELLVTQIHNTYEGDTYLPQFEQDFQLIKEIHHDVSESNSDPITFLTYMRRQK